MGRKPAGAATPLKGDASIITDSAGYGAQKQVGVSVGIDLGTTYSCVGTWRNDQVDILPNKEGNRTTPSYVAFTGSERQIGDRAKEQAQFNPLNTVFDAKRYTHTFTLVTNAL